MKHIIHKPATTYKVEMYHPNSMQKMGGYRPKNLAEARKLTREILKSGYDADVSVYKKGKFVWKENPEDFARLKQR